MKNERSKIFHEMAVTQGYIPSTCTLDGELIILLINKGEDPCAGCNEDRKICQGRPKRDIISI